MPPENPQRCPDVHASSTARIESNPTDVMIRSPTGIGWTGGFGMNLRLNWPKPAALDGTWQPPEVKLVGAQ
jgi:hypothetical protein